MATCTLLLSFGAQTAWAQSADLTIVKSGPATVTAGQNASYAITVTNAGPDPAENVTWDDVLPASTTFVSVGQNSGPIFSCSTPAVGAGGTVTCTFPSFAVGSPATFTLVVNVSSTATVTVVNTATVSSSTPDPDSKFNSSTTNAVVVSSADLSVTKSAPASVIAGQNLAYTITAKNAGPSAATNAVLTDALPAGLTFVSLSAPGGWTCTTPAVGAGGTVTCTNGSFAPGSGVFTLVANVPSATPAGTTLSNTASVSSATADPMPGDNSAFANTVVTAAPAPDLTITKTHNGNAQQGQTGLQYTLTVANAGSGPTSGTVTVSDALPSGLTATALSGSGWSCNLGALTCSRSDALNAGGAYPPITLTANVASNAPATVTNTATVSGGGDTNLGNNTAADPTTITPTGPRARSFILSIRAGTSTSVDLTDGAAGGPFTSASILSVTPSSAGTATISPSGGAFILTFTSTSNVAQTVVITFTLSSAAGTSAPATVTITIVPRRDPTQDPDVRGLLSAQVATAERFANAQILNFNRRLESLRDHGCGGFSQGISVAPAATTPSADMFSDLSAQTSRGSSEPTSIPTRTAPSSPGSAPGRASGCGTSPWPGLAFWTSGNVMFGDLDATARRTRFDFTTSGVSAGADYRWSESLLVGFGFGFGRDSTQIGNNGTESRARTFDAALYGSLIPMPHTFVDAVLGFGRLSYTSQRWAVDEAAFAFGERNGQQWFGSLTAGYEYRSNGLLLSPYGRLNFGRLTLDPFTETGGGGTGALSFLGQEAMFVTAVLGWRGKYDFLTSWGMLSPRARIEYNHAFRDTGLARLSYADWLDGPSYSIGVDAAKSDYVNLGAGTDLAFWSSFLLSIDYQTAVTFAGEPTHVIQIKLGTRF